MSSVLLAVAMAFVPLSRAGVVAAPRLTGSLGSVAGIPTLGTSSPALAAPSLSAPLSLTAPSLSAPAKTEAPRLMLPTAVPALPAIPALPALANLVSPSAKAEPSSKSLDDSAAEAKALFDGGRAAAPGEGWTLDAFEGDGGAPIQYKSREGT
ncbi:MAG: hypothetical protein NUW21_11555, partial [Elusimicrobia bacterium]|nr:hypothetical protein [Elusimicrobiota bacterium]